MSKRTLITFLFWAGAAALLLVALLAADAMGWEGLCLLLGLAVLSVLAAASCFVRWLIWGSVEETAEREQRAPERKAHKELGKIKKHSDANTAALLQYINDALRDGSGEEAVRTGLLEKGWAEGQVETAFSAYKDLLARFPLPEKGLKA
jgi:hypothetical protein